MVDSNNKSWLHCRTNKGNEHCWFEEDTYPNGLKSLSGPNLLPAHVAFECNMI